MKAPARYTLRMRLQNNIVRRSVNVVRVAGRIGLVLICGAASTMARAEWPALQKLQNERGASITAMVYDLDTEKSVAVLGPQQRLSPASLTKLVLAATVLEQWPGDHRFITRVVGTKPGADGVINSDLWISGEGDPSIEHRDMWLLAARLKQAGVTQISGDIVTSAAPFGHLECEIKDRCDAEQRTHTAYDAPLSAVGVDYGTWCIDLAPQLPGQPAALSHCAAFDVPIPMEGSIATRKPGSRGAMWLDRRSVLRKDQLVMGGNISQDTRLYRSMSDPALGAGLLLRQALAELGIKVMGGVRVSEFAAPSNLVALAGHEGAPIREQVAGLLRYSNNYTSDMLTLGLALERTPQPISTLVEASQLLKARLERARIAVGLINEPTPRAPIVLHSGSGLTPENRLSAEDLVALLRDEYRHMDRFPLFYAGLVVPGDAPGRLLRLGNDDWRQRVALKTGTLSEPISVFGTSGYLRKKNGGWMAFAVIVNGAPRKGIPVSVSLAAIRSDIEDLLARY